MTPADHTETRRLGAQAARDHLAGLVGSDQLSQEGAESYVAGLIDGAVDFLTGPLNVAPPIARAVLMFASRHLDVTLREMA